MSFRLENLNRISLTRNLVEDETEKDEILTKVIKNITNGWPAKCRDDSLHPFWTRRDELELQGKMIIWNDRPVLPKSLIEPVMKELHRTHAGASRMKALARQNFWYPSMDKKIGTIMAICCYLFKNGPDQTRAPLHPWQMPEKAWQRLHVDFAGPFHGAM